MFENDIVWRVRIVPVPIQQALPMHAANDDPDIGLVTDHLKRIGIPLNPSSGLVMKALKVVFPVEKIVAMQLSPGIRRIAALPIRLVESLCNRDQCGFMTDDRGDPVKRLVVRLVQVGQQHNSSNTTTGNLRRLCTRPSPGTLGLYTL